MVAELLGFRSSHFPQLLEGRLHRMWGDAWRRSEKALLLSVDWCLPGSAARAALPGQPEIAVEVAVAEAQAGQGREPVLGSL